MLSFKAVSAPPRRGEFITRRLNGGLHYGWDYALTGSELRDGGDFDLSPGGSVDSRRPLRPFTTSELPAPIVGSWAWQDNSGADHMFAVTNAGDILVCTNPTILAASFVPSAFGNLGGGRTRIHAWSAGGWLYVSNGTVVKRWGGFFFPVVADRTTASYHPLAIAPEVTNLGVLPNGTAAVYHDIVFIGDVLAGMQDQDAVWWSAPIGLQADGTPLAGQVTGQEDFYDGQRIAFRAGAQGDRITRLIAAGPNLYAFKERSIHVMSGNGDKFFNNDLAVDLGLAGPEAACAHGATVYFFDQHLGLHALSGGSLPERVFDPLLVLLQCNVITNPERIAVGYDGNKVFVSCSIDSPVNNVTFVLNTDIQATSKGGAWARWDVGFSSFCRWEPADGDSSLVGFCTSPLAAVRLNECFLTMFDDFGFTTRRIKPWFRTAFFDDGLPTLVKRWGRIALTVAGNDRIRLTAIATNGHGPQPPVEMCELPAPANPDVTIQGAHQGHVDVDLFPYELACFDPCIELSESLCDSDSWGVTYDQGARFCGPVLGNPQTAMRLSRIASPGTGVSFGVEVRDAGSDSPWGISELDVKYIAVPNLCEG